MKYDFIGTHANDFPVKLLCRQLGVQRSAYYDWRAQPGKLIAPEELALRRRMKELFAASRGSLGSRMMMTCCRSGLDPAPGRVLSNHQLAVNHGRILDAPIKPTVGRENASSRSDRSRKRKFKVQRTTDRLLLRSQADSVPTCDKLVLNREFSPSIQPVLAPNQAWGSDISICLILHPLTRALKIDPR